MLKVLPPDISNLIAAGEVVSRPASVVKELVENAVDAGASTVSVVIIDAGRTLIQVIDDGCGMSSQDALLCFERHATSKISTASDLDAISTFGFRGEALPSIAAVAEVSLRTRREEDEVGTRVLMAASSLVSQEPVMTPRGCNFVVRNLFYNVPARRKFLKSENAEMKHITGEFIRIALTRPGIALRLVSNGRDIYNLRAVHDLRTRIHDLFGRDLENELSPLSTETSVVKVSGFIGDPKDARKTAGNQYLFVNGRFFRSPYFHKAVCRPYEKLIPEGAVPTYFIFLETAPDKVDVNVHPAKTEVRFEDESMVFEILMACVRESLGRNSMIPSIDFDMQGAPEIPTIQSARISGAGGHVRPPAIDYDPLFNPFDTSRCTFEREKPDAGTPSVEGIFGSRLDDSVGEESPMIIVKGRYIVIPSREGLTLIHVTRARERIFFERYLEYLVEDQPLVQQSLFPQTVKLSPSDYLTVTGEMERIGAMGFDIQDFGDSSIVVYGLPEGYSADEQSVRKVIDDLVAALSDTDVTSDFKTQMAARMARSAAASRTQSLSDSEARTLVGELMECREPSLTPSGQRTMTTLSVPDIDKLL